MDPTHAQPLDLESRCNNLPLIDSIGSDLLLPIALIALRKLKRTCTQYPIFSFIFTQGLTPTFNAFMSQFFTIEIPKTIKEALNNPKGKEAMFKKIENLERNET